VNTVRARPKELDEACAEAADLARSAAVELAGPDRVGDYVGAEADGERLVTHMFASTDLAYMGWRWSVTVSRASRSKIVTVDEVVLLPGPDSMLAPPWVPWSERVRPGDIGVGDLMPAGPDDERLVPLASLQGEDGVLEWDDSAAWDQDEQLGPRQAIGADAPRRSRVLSAIGRDETAERWYTSDHGPGTPLAHAAPGPCASCGFLTLLAGPLGRVFGVCANEYAPDDGRVVSLDHGCGAHSEAVTGEAFSAMMPVIDEIGYDLVDPPGVAMEDTVFETLDHGE
jgi:Protein of unknown function (DUF3027)